MNHRKENNMSQQDIQSQTIRETLPPDEIIWQTSHEDMLRESALV